MLRQCYASVNGMLPLCYRNVTNLIIKVVNEAVYKANFRYVNGVNIGLFCSTPMVALSRNIPRKQAFEMLSTGSFISAERADLLCCYHIRK